MSCIIFHLVFGWRPCDEAYERAVRNTRRIYDRYHHLFKFSHIQKPGHEIGRRVSIKSSSVSDSSRKEEESKKNESDMSVDFASSGKKITLADMMFKLNSKTSTSKSSEVQNQNEEEIKKRSSTVADCYVYDKQKRLSVHEAGGRTSVDTSHIVDSGPIKPAVWSPYAIAHQKKVAKTSNLNLMSQALGGGLGSSVVLRSLGLNNKRGSGVLSSLSLSLGRASTSLRDRFFGPNNVNDNLNAQELVNNIQSQQETTSKESLRTLMLRSVTWEVAHQELKKSGLSDAEIDTFFQPDPAHYLKIQDVRSNRDNTSTTAVGKWELEKQIKRLSSNIQTKRSTSNMLLASINEDSKLIDSSEDLNTNSINTELSDVQSTASESAGSAADNKDDDSDDEEEDGYEMNAAMAALIDEVAESWRSTIVDELRNNVENLNINVENNNNTKTVTKNKSSTSVTSTSTSTSHNDGDDGKKVNSNTQKMRQAQAVTGAAESSEPKSKGLVTGAAESEPSKKNLDPLSRKICMSEVRKHFSPEDLWMAINGFVLDVLFFIHILGRRLFIIFNLC